MNTADVVVVGGGITGAFTTFYLTSLGVGTVTLVEQSTLAGGATGQSCAGVEGYHEDMTMARLAAASLSVFRKWGDQIGGDCGWREVGFIRLEGRGPSDLSRTTAEISQLGVPSQMLDSHEVPALDPGIAINDVAEASYEPAAGYADPLAATYGLIRAAEGLGAGAEVGTTVHGIRVHRGRIVAVDTTSGPISTPVVVLAPGAWTDRLLRPFGVEWPVIPTRVAVARLRGSRGQHLPTHSYFDAQLGIWLRPDGDRDVLVTLPDSEPDVDPDAEDPVVPREVAQRIRSVAAQRFPALQSATPLGGWSGVVTVTTDGRPIIDEVPGVSGLFAIAGDNGAGFKTAPAIGRGVAEWIFSGAPTTVDLHSFEASRQTLLDRRAAVDETRPRRI